MPTCTNTTHLSINGILRQDPARIGAIQKRFATEFRRRLKSFQRELVNAIVTLDVFGLTDRSHALRFNVEPRQYEFLRSDAKVDEFMKWLDEMVRKEILTVERRAAGTIGTQVWSDVYIQSAYQQAIRKARRELRRQGYDVPPDQVIGGRDSVITSFNAPFHADRVALAYTRTFNGMKGLTDSIKKDMSRVLAQGLAEGRSPYDIAKGVSDLVDGNIKRANMIARTEVANAHHQATVNEFEQWGVEGVSVVAEWLTAGFGVCPVCEDLAKGGDIAPGLYSLNQIRGMIPVHPNCRCTITPVAAPSRLSSKI